MRLGRPRQQLSLETRLRLFRSSYVGAQIHAIGTGIFAARSSLYSERLMHSQVINIKGVASSLAMRVAGDFQLSGPLEAGNAAYPHTWPFRLPQSR